MNKSDSQVKQSAQQLLDFIDSSPSPWHAVTTLEKQLQQFDFIRLDEKASWELDPSGRYYVVRDDSSIIVFVVGKHPLDETGFKIVGAHTDSPGLRVKPKPAPIIESIARVGVEVYGGPILATFTDRDLSLAGRVSCKVDGNIETLQVCFKQPLLRLPNLAIHMNREVNTKGLKLDKQNELPLIISTLAQEMPSQPLLNSLIAEHLELSASQIMSWELNAYDTQKGSFWGSDNEFIADSQLDNLASCHAAISALLNEQTLTSGNTLVCAFFDHEEIGSETVKGASGSFLPDVLERISFALNLTQQDARRALAHSFLISADMAHAYQPSFPNAYETDHIAIVNGGPVIKINANHRYATESVSEAHFIKWCELADTPYQKYSHRTDLPCGSTIGPISSAKLGIRSIDVGNPMWAMHSIRESAGVFDHQAMINVMHQFFKEV